MTEGVRDCGSQCVDRLYFAFNITMCNLKIEECNWTMMIGSDFSPCARCIETILLLFALCLLRFAGSVVCVYVWCRLWSNLCVIFFLLCSPPLLLIGVSQYQLILNELWWLECSIMFVCRISLCCNRMWIVCGNYYVALLIYVNSADCWNHKNHSSADKDCLDCHDHRNQNHSLFEVIEK